MLVVGDDCALPYSRLVGRRGIAGTVFVHKVLPSPYTICSALPLPAALFQVTNLSHERSVWAVV